MTESPDDHNDREDLNETGKRIRDLNDDLRRNLSGGQILVTPGFRSLTEDIKARALKAIQDFDSFTDANDPYGTHEFGSVDIDGQSVWFKIDAYDLNLEYASPDPSNPNVTQRVMTILLPEEY